MSTYTGRYQSRFFNFVAEQSLRLSTATAKAARHVRFAAQTAVQAVLYPVYAIFQTARRLDRQFSSRSRQANPLPACDRPIEDVLEEVERLNLTSEPIRGIASSRADGQLQLVSPENRPPGCDSTLPARPSRSVSSPGDRQLLASNPQSRTSRP